MVTDGMEIVAPSTVAETVRVYCNPLVTAQVLLEDRLPRPLAYQVAMQEPPCQSWIVAMIVESISPV